MHDLKFSKSYTLYSRYKNSLGIFALVSCVDSCYLSVWTSVVWLVMPSRSVTGVLVPFSKTKIGNLLKGTEISENNSDLGLQPMDCSAGDNPDKFILRNRSVQSGIQYDVGELDWLCITGYSVNIISTYI